MGKERFVDLIQKKKNGETLTKEEIDFMITDYVAGKIPDYQMSAMLMAIYCKDFPSPVLGIANMVKVPGRDLEFYLMTWKNAECSDFEWVHYFAGKKP